MIMTMWFLLIFLNYSSFLIYNKPEIILGETNRFNNSDTHCGIQHFLLRQSSANKANMPNSTGDEWNKEDSKSKEVSDHLSGDDSGEDVDLETKIVGPLLDWIEKQKAGRGEYPLMRLTPQIVELLTGNSKLSENQQGELVSFLAKRAASYANSSTQQQQHSRAIPTKKDSPKLAPTSFAMLHPTIAQRYKIKPTLDPREYYTFKNEREELGRAISLKQKLGVTNKLELVVPEAVMKTDKINGWMDHEIQCEAKDWSIHSTHMVWLGLMFQNDADIRDLRTRREMINEAKYADLKELYLAIELGTPM